MTTFGATGFTYETEDKGFEYPTQILEEPFGDFFEQYLSHAISGLDDHCNDVDIPDLFTDGDTTSSASYATDSTSSAQFNPSYNVPINRKENISLTKSAFQPQNFHSRGRREKIVPAVSGLELLLDIEGRTTSSPHRPDPPHSAPATLTSLPLRRKPRFNKSKSKDLQDRDHRICKSSAYQGKDQANMIRPLYNHRVESPQPHEWSHGLEQLSLNSAISPFAASHPLPHTDPSQIEPDSTNLHTSHTTLREQFLQGEIHGQYNDLHAPEHTFPDIGMVVGKKDIGLGQEEVREKEDTLGILHHNRESQRATSQRQPRHSASWTPSVSSSGDATLTFSTDQAETSWNHGLPDVTSSCYTNDYASKSAPVLPYQQYIDGAEGNARGMSDSVDTFITEDPSVDYIVEGQQFLPFDFNSHEYPPPPELDPTTTPSLQEHSHSPPRRTSSPSAHHSPSHTRRRSKSTQRRKSAGNLKSGKSPVTMDFVNFTPSDSKRILTGVAPSGSSKTKARREQEANEKKRKLSLAVLRAVEEAGGDPEPLRKGGLLADS